MASRVTQKKKPRYLSAKMIELVANPVCHVPQRESIKGSERKFFVWKLSLLSEGIDLKWVWFLWFLWEIFKKWQMQRSNMKKDCFHCSSHKKERLFAFDPTCFDDVFCWVSFRVFWEKFLHANFSSDQTENPTAYNIYFSEENRRQLSSILFTVILLLKSYKVKLPLLKWPQ